MIPQQQLCAPFTPREESSPWGLACDWHCDAAARPRVMKKSPTTKRPRLELVPAPLAMATIVIPPPPTLLAAPAHSNGPQW